MTIDTRLTLAMEELILDPRYAEMAHACQQLLPTAVRDQHAAANLHARRVGDQIGKHLESTMLTPEAHQIPGWLRLGLIEAWVGHCSGSASTCRHMPSIDSPQPVTAAAWRPGLIVCVYCVFLLMPVSGSVMDKTCDGCGHICEGVDRNDPIHPSTISFGSLIYQFGICGDCRIDYVTMAGGTV